MIHAEFSTDGNGLLLTVRGHAGSASYGHDIICASASILVGTLAQSVIDSNDEQLLQQPPDINLECGEAFIGCIPAEEQFDRVLGIYKVIQTGFLLLEHEHFQYVCVDPFEEE